MAEEVTIATLGARGDGVTAEGLYVPYALPGERVSVEPMGDRARLLSVIEKAVTRVEPSCPHFMTCGGCAVQHASDRLVADWKTGIIRTALAARGIEGVRMRPMVTSPPASRRRVTATARRTKKTVQIGFHAPNSDRIVEISACVVARPELIDILPLLEELVTIAASRKGEVRLALTMTDGGVDLAISDAKEVDGPGRALLAGAANRAGLARLSWNGEVAVERMAPTIHMGPARVTLPPGGFLQATEDGEAALVAAVREAVGGAKRIADLYAGSGTFTLPLAEKAEVLAFESDYGAVDALDRAWRDCTEIPAVTATRRDLVKRPLLPAEFRNIDAIVIDPPRAGARVQFDNIAKTEVPRIASISCNPATFARDARILIDAGYHLDWVQPVDQFRWAAHVELAAQFSRG
ncbi:class I SAM-dependent RNA methyltransferase [Rhodobacteraceae bacterium NNCM2]|nr:class I SAM-dependent RNA methyltransferase [Coraliihabitans acroporae]